MNWERWLLDSAGIKTTVPKKFVEFWCLAFISSASLWATLGILMRCKDEKAVDAGNFFLIIVYILLVHEIYP